MPSKAFGEYILHHDRSPEVSAAELHAWQEAGRDLVIFDSRPLDEYRRKTDVEAAIREYLEWEVDLVNATKTDRDFGFRRFA